jgi:hypothetical protein
VKDLELIKFHHLSVKVHKAQVIIIIMTMMMIMIIIIIINKHRCEYGAVLSVMAGHVDDQQHLGYTGMCTVNDHVCHALLLPKRTDTLR